MSTDVSHNIRRWYEYDPAERRYYITEEQMAAEKNATSPSIAAEAKNIITCVPQVSQDPLVVLVVGAGGTGARVVPPLTQMLRSRDKLFIMDHDIVEDRNLARQHFTERDIGQPKALVLAQRYRKRDLTPIALVSKLTTSGLAQAITNLDAPHRCQLAVIGCVDNNDARAAMNRLIVNASGLPTRITSYAYVDVGNERRGGQVLMSFRAWPLGVSTLTNVSPGVLRYSMHTMSEGMPQLCKPVPWRCDDCAVSNPPEATACAKCGREAGSCGNRLDLQTVMVNHMAAGMALNCLSWLMLGIPFSSAGAFFSTLNTMQPIRITSVDYNVARLRVDTSFAA